MQNTHEQHTTRVCNLWEQWWIVLLCDFYLYDPYFRDNFNWSLNALLSYAVVVSVVVLCHVVIVYGWLSSTRFQNGLKEQTDIQALSWGYWIFQKNPQVGSRKLAEIFECGRMQIQSILKKKDAIMEEYESNITPDSRRCHQRSVCDEINISVYKWYSQARQRNVPVSQWCKKRPVWLLLI